MNNRDESCLPIVPQIYHLMWAVVVAQWVERLLPTPQIRGIESSHYKILIEF